MSLRFVESSHYRRSLLGGVFVNSFACLMLSACGQSNEQAATPGTGAPIAGAPLPTKDMQPGATAPNINVSPEDLEAESSLSIKRGIITLTGQSRSIRLCGSNIDLTLSDQLDGALDRTYADLGSKPIYAEMYGERGDVTPGNAASNSFNVEELLFASVAQTRSCETAVGQYELLAHGGNPTWSVEVLQDAMVFRQSNAPTEIKFGSVETADAEGTVTYRAGVDRHVLELAITQRPCRDATSGEYFAYTATARLDKQVFNGCARVGN